jgi:hypothetical protein
MKRKKQWNICGDNGIPIENMKSDERSHWVALCLCACACCMLICFVEVALCGDHRSEPIV